MSHDPRPESLALLDRFEAALIGRGVLTPAQIADQQTRAEKGSPAIGAAMVARAWTDPAYRDLMLRDGHAAATVMGLDMRGVLPLGVLADTEDVHHLVVCTLCSCYPRAVLGYPPGWYKSAAYRARAVSDPRGVMAEWGTTLPDGMRLRVVDSTADWRWMVLPRRPDGTDDWPEDRLAALIGAPELMGLRLPRAA
ncbi:nitrile hydratase subunit alpha [Roseomonas sp. CCTCC AB2023176]|uniref:nitrile hydratase subunit alpha n=1 Tax=Roseomonas sp. CCTCC AB2023176 TaxID=3342640 RepID=UPI0035DB8873